MILAIDIGNSTVVLGIIIDGNIIVYKKTATDVSEIEVNYKYEIISLIKSHNIPLNAIEGAIISSVVPLLNDKLNEDIKEIFNFSPIMVNYKSPSGIKIVTDTPYRLGSDRIANAAAGVKEYGVPLVIIDMGTATTISLINSAKEFIGGLIIPGVKTSLNSLVNNTSQLPRIKHVKPSDKIIGSDTLQSIKNGVIYGNAAMIDGLLNHLYEEMGKEIKAVATGGNAADILPYCRKKIIYDRSLLLKGLYAIYQSCKGES